MKNKKNVVQTPNMTCIQKRKTFLTFFGRDQKWKFILEFNRAVSITEDQIVFIFIIAIEFQIALNASQT